MDDVRIYNRTLTTAECSSCTNCAGAAAYWNFDEKSGTSANDKSGNSVTEQLIAALGLLARLDLL